MNASELELARSLLRGHRWAALATVRNGTPYASMAAYATAPDLSCLYLHLSRLAPHTQNLLKHPEVALVISAPDDGATDPQTLARLSIQGRLEPIPPGQPGYEQAKTHYIERLPDSAGLFDFSDFMLLRLVPEKLRLVGGFARAYSLSPQELVVAQDAPSS